MTDMTWKVGTDGAMLHVRWTDHNNIAHEEDLVIEKTEDKPAQLIFYLNGVEVARTNARQSLMLSEKRLRG